MFFADLYANLWIVYQQRTICLTDKTQPIPPCQNFLFEFWNLVLYFWYFEINWIWVNCFSLSYTIYYIKIEPCGPKRCLRGQEAHFMPQFDSLLFKLSAFSFFPITFTWNEMKLKDCLNFKWSHGIDKMVLGKDIFKYI